MLNSAKSYQEPQRGARCCSSQQKEYRSNIYAFFILYHVWDVLLSNFLKTSYICIENNPYALSKLGIEAEHVCKTLWNWKSINSSKSNTFLLLTS